jgi:hypothetical protein
MVPAIVPDLAFSRISIRCQGTYATPNLNIVTKTAWSLENPKHLDQRILSSYTSSHIPLKITKPDYVRHIHPRSPAMSPPPQTTYKLIFLVPPPSLQKCKDAAFSAGAGRHPGLGDYTECCSEVVVKGQFRPGKSARPFIGAVGTLEEVEEVRVEMVCVGREVVRGAVEALRR